MRQITICGRCRGKNIDYIGNDRCYCHDCKAETVTVDKYISTPYERARNAVYATGNKWAIENWNATHNW